MAADLRSIYVASALEQAQIGHDECERQWGVEHPPIVQSWRSNWDRIARFFDYLTEADHLHGQCNRVGEYEFAQDHKKP